MADIKRLAEIIAKVITSVKWIIDEPIFTLEEISESGGYQTEIWLSSEEIDLYRDELIQEFNLDEKKIEKEAQGQFEVVEKRFEVWKQKMKEKFPELTLWFEED
jgi:hypothetical protein